MISIHYTFVALLHLLHFYVIIVRVCFCYTVMFIIPLHCCTLCSVTLDAFVTFVTLLVTLFILLRLVHFCSSFTLQFFFCLLISDLFMTFHHICSF